MHDNRFHSVAGQQLFTDQYYHIYNARLLAAREALIKSSRFRWGNDVKNVPLEQLNASLGSTDVFVIGTLFKVMPKQPSILRELEDNEQTPVGPDVNFTSDEDSLVLHETDENVRVVGDIDADVHVTGIPVSLLGHQIDGGAKFHVNDVCYAGPSLSVYRQPQANGCSSQDASNDRLIIVSGLQFGLDSSLVADRAGKLVGALKRLRDFVLRDLNAHDFNGYSDHKVVRLIVAGNSVAPGIPKSKSNISEGGESKDNTRSLAEVFQLFDRYLYMLAQSGADIDVMPGKNDPTSILLPQQPFHPKILPLSGQLENVHPRPNPCILSHEGRTYLGTSGETIDAIRQHSKIEFSTTILKNTLEWGHVAPSAPDNLSCVPFRDRDPFLIDFVPDIYFAGNQPEFAVTTYSTENKAKIQLISVPSFADTFSCVSVNLANLEVELLNLG